MQKWSCAVSGNFLNPIGFHETRRKCSDHLTQSHTLVFRLRKNSHCWQNCIPRWEAAQ
ncbi:hypothetical protein DK52_3247 [Brucella abortus]|nr:hypothetical protein DK52_3247 [Brucella abortus]